MKKHNTKNFIVGGILLLFCACQLRPDSVFKKALTFHASFDSGTTADFALGDANIYTADASYVDSKRVLEGIEEGMTNTDHEIVAGRGRFGDAFEFGKKSRKVIYYKSKDNIAYDAKELSGSISFYLSVDPVTDLDGYTDPIQITDVNYNDASIWVDFTDADPPDFRLGVIGDKDVWTLDTLASSSKIEFERRLVHVDEPQFSRSTWTHVVLTYDGLGTRHSLSTLYLDGVKQGSVKGIDDPFTWDLDQSNIFLGLGYTGLIDELSIFNTAFTDDQVRELYQLAGGVTSIL